MEEPPPSRPEPRAAAAGEGAEAPAGSLALRFQQSFLAGRRLDRFPWEDLEKILKISRDSSPLLSILQKTVFHPLCLKYPPSVKYRRCFLSELIKKHEAIGAEPLDLLYEALGHVLNAEETAHCYKNYLLPSGEAISLGESVAIISQGTTGLVTWEAGLHLAEWALENPAVFANRTILELGSGIGLTGIAICKACRPRKYTFSDHHPSVLQQLLENICSNGFLPESEVSSCGPAPCATQKAGLAGLQGPKVTVAELDWNLATEEGLAGLSADVVIAADVVYDPELMESLIRVLQRLPSCPDGKKAPEIYIAFAVRNPETYRCFQTKLANTFGVVFVQRWTKGDPLSLVELQIPAFPTFGYSSWGYWELQSQRRPQGPSEAKSTTGSTHSPFWKRDQIIQIKLGSDGKWFLAHKRTFSLTTTTQR